MLLGTAAYMSPEQAKGRPADKRSDVWAFGCVLFEMLTGRRAFAGDEVTDTLAEVLKGTPDWTALPAATPQNIRRLLRRCLEKDRKERLADLGTARLDIKDALIAPADDLLREPAPSWRHRLLPMGLAILVTALLAGYGAWTVARSAPTLGEPCDAITARRSPIWSGDTWCRPGRSRSKHPTESKCHRVVARWTHAGVPGQPVRKVCNSISGSSKTCKPQPFQAHRARTRHSSRRTARGLASRRQASYDECRYPVGRQAGSARFPAAMQHPEYSARAGEMAT